MFIVWLLVGIMFGGMAGIFAMCLVVAGAKCDRAMARARKEMERNGYVRRKVIRFVDQFNNSLFSILDGDPIQTINQRQRNGIRSRMVKGLCQRKSWPVCKLCIIPIFIRWAF